MSVGLKSVRVKICGLTRRQDMELAVELGADFVGLVFSESPRRVDADALAAWLGPARGAAEVVGVFRGAGVEEVLAQVERFDLDLVQVHDAVGEEGWDRLPVRLIEARGVDAGGVAPSRFGGAAWADLLDTRQGGRTGGTGRVFDWSLAAPVARARRVFLAGGLDAANVVAAIEAVRPFAVDVSSGVEAAPGRKDPQRLRDFFAAVKEAPTR